MSARALRFAFAAARTCFPAVPARVAVALVGDASMAALHGRYRSDPTTTDVLSFDLRGGADVDASFDAQIVIGVDVARREAARRGIELQREVDLYLVHGLLHLAGFDDHAPRDRSRMRRAERRVLRLLNAPSAAERRRGARRSRGP